MIFVNIKTPDLSRGYLLCARRSSIKVSNPFIIFCWLNELLFWLVINLAAPNSISSFGTLARSCPPEASLILPATVLSGHSPHRTLKYLGSNLQFTSSNLSFSIFGKNSKPYFLYFSSVFLKKSINFPIFSILITTLKSYIQLI